MTVGIRARVVNVIKSWVTKLYTRSDDDSIFRDIKVWAKSPFVADFLTARNQNLIRLIDGQLENNDVHELHESSEGSPPILTNNVSDDPKISKFSKSTPSRWRGKSRLGKWTYIAESSGVIITSNVGGVTMEMVRIPLRR